jgi:hypothetical protein
LALGHLVAAAFVLGGDRLAGLFIDELLAQAIAGGLVDLPKGDALGTRAGRMERTLENAWLTARSVRRSRFRARHKSALFTMRLLAARP